MTALAAQAETRRRQGRADGDALREDAGPPRAERGSTSEAVASSATGGATADSPGVVMLAPGIRSSSAAHASITRRSRRRADSSS
jgi:hypothetical protein